ncbi:hypothetical protein GF337_06925 [candidate division KSB1 bacterium]|nr:hypothetical protein [candidate division KSB1 bacterium]
MSDEGIKSTFGPVIYRRGVNYFKQGRVQLESVTLDHFTATVEGTYFYNVKGILLDDRISLTCDCPYYTYCKHGVAALLALRKYLKEHGDQLRMAKSMMSVWTNPG